MISERWGVNWCEENERGRSPFIVDEGTDGRGLSSSWSTAQRVNGMGDGRGGVVLPGEAQWRGGEAWGGADRSECFDALSGSDGGFDGPHRSWSARRRTGMSAGLLGRW